MLCVSCLLQRERRPKARAECRARLATQARRQEPGVAALYAHASEGTFNTLLEWLQSGSSVGPDWDGYEAIIQVLNANGCSHPQYVVLLDFADIQWPEGHKVGAVGKGLLRTLLAGNAVPVTPANPQAKRLACAFGIAMR